MAAWENKISSVTPTSFPEVQHAGIAPRNGHFEPLPLGRPCPPPWAFVIEHEMKPNVVPEAPGLDFCCTACRRVAATSDTVTSPATRPFPALGFFAPASSFWPLSVSPRLLPSSGGFEYKLRCESDSAGCHILAVLPGLWPPAMQPDDHSISGLRSGPSRRGGFHPLLPLCEKHVLRTKQHASEDDSALPYGPPFCSWRRPLCLLHRPTACRVI